MGSPIQYPGGVADATVLIDPATGLAATIALDVSDLAKTTDITDLAALVGAIDGAAGDTGNANLHDMIRSLRDLLYNADGIARFQIRSSDGTEMGTTADPFNVRQATLTDADVVGAAPMGDSVQIGVTSAGDGTGRKTLSNFWKSVTASGNTELIAAVGAKKIRLVTLYIHTRGALDIKLQSATTDMGPLWPFAANQKREFQFNARGHFENINVNEAVNLNLSGAGTVAVSGTYYTV